MLKSEEYVPFSEFIPFSQYCLKEVTNNQLSSDSTADKTTYFVSIHGPCKKIVTETQHKEDFTIPVLDWEDIVELEEWTNKLLDKVSQKTTVLESALSKNWLASKIQMHKSSKDYRPIVLMPSKHISLVNSMLESRHNDRMYDCLNYSIYGIMSNSYLVLEDKTEGANTIRILPPKDTLGRIKVSCNQFGLCVFNTAVIHDIVIEEKVCQSCQGTRIGQKWDADTRMMVTIPDGCPRCGNNPV